MGRLFSVKRLILSVMVALAALFVCKGFVLNVYAADAQVRFGSNYYDKNQGERFPIGLYVVNTDGSVNGIGSYHVEISYDANLLEYSEGATSQDGKGRLILEGVGDGNQNKTFLYFNALYGGTANVTITSAVVYQTDGTAMNVTALGNAPVYIKGTPPENNDGDGADGDNSDGNGDADSIGNGNDDGSNGSDSSNDAGSNADDSSQDAGGAGDGDAAGAVENIPDSIPENNNVSEEYKNETSDLAVTEGAIAGVEEVGENQQNLEQVDDASSDDSGGKYNYGKNVILKYVIVAIAAIVAIVILIFVIRGIIHIIEGRRKFSRMMNNDNSDREWAFEFDTIDEDREQLEALDETVAEFDNSTDADETVVMDSDLSEGEFLFDFDSIPKDKK